MLKIGRLKYRYCGGYWRYLNKELGAQALPFIWRYGKTLWIGPFGFDWN